MSFSTFYLIQNQFSLAKPYNKQKYRLASEKEVYPAIGQGYFSPGIKKITLTIAHHAIRAEFLIFAANSSNEA
jgi:hypothetical protein